MSDLKFCDQCAQAIPSNWPTFRLLAVDGVATHELDFHSATCLRRYIDENYPVAVGVCGDCRCDGINPTPHPDTGVRGLCPTCEGTGFSFSVDDAPPTPLEQPDRVAELLADQASINTTEPPPPATFVRRTRHHSFGAADVIRHLRSLEGDQ